MLALLKIPNVRLLFLAQALGMAVPPFNTLLGGIVGSALAPDPRFATLPVALMTVGLAASVVPVAVLMRQKGRRFGFLFANAVAIAGALLAAIAIQGEDFWLFCLATLLLGVNLAAVAQYRFAATENVTQDDVPRAVSLVLLGTLVAAFLGPLLVQSAEATQGISRDAAAYLMLAALLAVSLLLLLRYRDVFAAEKRAAGEARPLREIASQRRFIVAVAASAIGYGVMVFLMTATPVSMHVMDGHALDHTAAVIQAHIAAMYLPSLASGWLIRRFGEARLLLAGIVILFACVAAAMLGREVVHYAVALILLGIGWNFLFVGGTTLLTQAWRPAERFRVQAANDFLVFTVMAAASLASGAAVYSAGWNTLLLVVLPPLAVLFVIVVASLRRLAAPASVSAQ
ncbi:MAG TPA: MFS transporter [Gammaproteobacteria bacterium]